MVVAALTAAYGPPAHASEGHASVSVIPLPRRRPAFIVGDLLVHGVVPVVAGTLCPTGASCLFGGGGGLGLSLELRWPTGIGAGVAYDAWFLNGHGVFKPTIIQSIRGVFRYVLPTDIVTHPFVRTGFGLTLLGDQNDIATLGLSVDAAIGGEFELSDTFALNMAVGLRLFSSGVFVTPSDSVTRGQGRGFGVAIYLEGGLAIFETR